MKPLFLRCLCSTQGWKKGRGFNKCAVESREKLEQGKRLESWVGGRETFPVECFQGMLLIAVQYCLNENFASHLSDRNRWASHESLDYFYRVDTVSHVADCTSRSSLLLMSLQPVLDTNMYIWGTHLSPGFISPASPEDHKAPDNLTMNSGQTTIHISGVKAPWDLGNKCDMITIKNNAMTSEWALNIILSNIHWRS